jgi:A/G-specific adenine glycosylase
MKEFDSFHFGKKLLAWHTTQNTRELPWKNINDVYKIWLSEVLLQQTRAEQAMPYYHNFTKQYPTVQALAKAPDNDVYKIWQGLGYYNRCKNMLATARLVTTTYKGEFPKSYDALLKLKGIGPYTAAAIASFAYEEDVAVVDGNVYRVLARIFNIDLPIDSSKGKKHFTQLAAHLLEKGTAKKHNQAIMDLGATICKPKNPLCTKCPFENNCLAFEKDLINQRPVKSKKLKVKERHFHYFWIEDERCVYLQQRSEKDVWPLLWEPLLIECENNFLPAQYVESFKPELVFKSKQRLTHQLIYGYFYNIKISKNQLNKLGLVKIDYQMLMDLSFSKTCLDFLKFHPTFI